MERPKYCESASAAEKSPGEETEIDVRRVVWDVEYREQVMAALRRRERTANAVNGNRSGHSRGKGKKPQPGGR